MKENEDIKEEEKKEEEKPEDKEDAEVSDGLHPLSREGSPVRESQETIMRASPRTEAIQNMKEEIKSLEDWTDE